MLQIICKQEWTLQKILQYSKQLSLNIYFAHINLSKVNNYSRFKSHFQLAKSNFKVHIRAIKNYDPVLYGLRKAVANYVLYWQCFEINFIYAKNHWTCSSLFELFELSGLETLLIS